MKFELRTEDGKSLGTYPSEQQVIAGDVVQHGGSLLRLLAVSDGQATVEIAEDLPKERRFKIDIKKRALPYAQRVRMAVLGDNK